MLLVLVPKANPDGSLSNEYNVVNKEHPEDETGITYSGQTAKIIENDLVI